MLKRVFSLVPILSPRQLANEMYGWIKTIVFFDLESQQFTFFVKSLQINYLST